MTDPFVSGKAQAKKILVSGTPYEFANIEIEWEAPKPEPTPEPPARHLHRAARRAYLGNTIGYPLRSGNKASRRQGARMAWRHGVILAMRKAQAEALASKVQNA